MPRSTEISRRTCTTSGLASSQTSSKHLPLLPSNHAKPIWNHSSEADQQLQLSYKIDPLHFSNDLAYKTTDNEQGKQ
jgi:hypothetical protein